MDNNIQVASLVQEIRALQREVEKLKTREYLSPKSTSYTPTWTASVTNPSIGDGTIGGYYSRVGNIIVYNFYLVARATTTFGAGVWILSVPKTIVGSGAGTLWFYDATGTQYSGSCRAGSANDVQLFGSANNLSANYPFTWANGDQIRGTFVYFA